MNKINFNHLIFSIFLLFSFISYSQTISINEIDKFTGEYIFQINASPKKKFRLIDAINKSAYESNRVYFSIQKRITKDNDIQIGLQFGITRYLFMQSTCFNENSYVVITTEDGKESKLFHQGEMDCDINVGVRFKVDNETLQHLSSQKVTHIRFHPTEGYLNYEIWPQKQDLVKNTCKMFLEEINK